MNVLMFSGQGSQYYRMGQSLFERQPVFRDHLERLDRFAAVRTGVSVIASLYGSGRAASEHFDDITLTNPAIFMIEFALARTLIDFGLRVDRTLGASLGAFAAMAVSGMMDEYDALGAVIHMANVADTAAPRGGMIAVLAPLAVREEPFLRENSEVAAVNFDSHFVISVSADRIDRVEDFLAGRDILFQRLPVAFAFHSRAMDCLEGPARALLARLGQRPGTIPFACCAHARLLTEVPPDYAWTLIRRPILFRETIGELERGGACHYIDVGPSGTLATFIRYLLPQAIARTSKIMDPFGDDDRNFAVVLNRYGDMDRQAASA